MSQQFVSPSSQPQAGRAQLREMITGCVPTPLIYVAAKLGIADLLRDGPRSVEDLAQAVGAVPRNLQRVLRALAGMGVFAETEDGRFALTPLAELLRSDVPHSQRAFALMFGEAWWWRPLGELLHTVRTGETAFDHLFGVPLYEYVGADPMAGEIFNAAMDSRNAAAELAEYDFADAGRIVDVGGGHGGLLLSILRAHPRMQGVLFDLPGVIADAAALIEAPDVRDRCRSAAGSFFESVPSGGDIYILSGVLHNWSDEKAVAILQSCHRAMQGGGKLLIVDNVVPAGNAACGSKLADVLMMTHVGGMERTESEFRALLQAAGFGLDKVLPAAVRKVIEATPLHGR